MRPRTNHGPAMLLEDRRLTPIPVAVLREFGSPVLRVRGGLRPVFGAAMPPTAVDEQGDSPASENHVRPDRPFAGNTYREVFAKPQASGVEGPTDRQLWSGVRTPIRLHDARSESRIWRVRGHRDLTPDAMRA